MNRRPLPILLVLLSAAEARGLVGAPDAARTPAPRAPLAAASATPKPSGATEGARLTYMERSRGVEQGVAIVHYTLKADGVPRDKSYALYGRRMNGTTAEIKRGVRIGDGGALLGPDGKDVDLSLGRMFAGEYDVFALIAADGTVKTFVEITPFPIQAEGKGGCRLQARPMDLRGQGFVITGSGFQPKKTLSTVTTSDGEDTKGSTNTQVDGTLKQVIFPRMTGGSGGEASYEVSDSACSAKVRFHWGDELRDTPGGASPSPAATPKPQRSRSRSPTASSTPRP
ncbi:MAG TPA: hypothetical protein VH854_00140 [Thermoanaerobaculia bacterium]|jgi:hypothetical protein|nr:hypothetical protein [Thermoanaerobaculia bacterium]